MQHYVSGSQIQQHRLRSFILPSPLGVLLYFLIGLLMLAALNATALWRIFPQDALPGITGRDIAPLTDRFISFQDKLATPTVMLLWTAIGIVTYTIIWLLENVVFTAKSEVQESQYLRGGLRPQKSYWRQALTSNALLLLVIIAWLSLIAMYLRILLPEFSQLFHDGLYSGTASERLINIAAAVLANGLIIYLLRLLQRTLSLAWRLNRPS